MKHTISNERGVGLIPFLVTTFVIGLIIAGMSSSILTMLRSQVSVAATAEASLLADQLQAALTNEIACTAALAGRVPDPTPAVGSEPATALNGVSVQLAGQDVVLNEGDEIVPGFRLVRFRMSEDIPALAATGLALPVYNDGADVVNNKRIKMMIQLQKTNEGIFSPLSQKKEFYLDANTRTATNRVKSCAARSVASDACVQMGGVWNPSLENDPVTGLPAEGNRCLSNQFCQYGGSFSALGTPAQAAFPNSMMNPPAYACPAGFERKQTGAVALANATSKSSINTTIAPIFSCLRCAQEDRAAIAGNNQTTDVFQGGNLLTDEINAANANYNATNTQTGVCATAQATAGNWSCSPVQNDCGPPPGLPSGSCNPRVAAVSRSSSCVLYYDMYGNPIPGYSQYNCSCPRVVPKPAGC